jgi:hypothetical protein
VTDERNPVQTEKQSNTPLANKTSRRFDSVRRGPELGAALRGIDRQRKRARGVCGLIFVGLAFGEHSRLDETLILLVIPILFGVAGIGLTETLFRLYRLCIERLMGCALDSHLRHRRTSATSHGLTMG